MADCFSGKTVKAGLFPNIDASGKRRKEKVVTLAGLKTREEQCRILGVKADSQITTVDLLARYKRHQKTLLFPGPRRLAHAA